MKPATDWRNGGQPGTARNMPMIAVNTISNTTRGLVSSRYWAASFRMRSFWLATRPQVGGHLGDVCRASAYSLADGDFDRMQRQGWLHPDQQRDQAQQQQSRDGIVRGGERKGQQQLDVRDAQGDLGADQKAG